MDSETVVAENLVQIAPKMPVPGGRIVESTGPIEVIKAAGMAAADPVDAVQTAAAGQATTVADGWWLLSKWMQRLDDRWLLIRW